MISVEEITTLSEAGLFASGASALQAAPVTRAIAAAEADGIASHGLAYLATYCEHLRCGKVVGKAVPEVAHPKPALLLADAKSGFAHPAIEEGFKRLIPLTRDMGIAALAVRNSYNCGVLGYHTERLAKAGLVGLGFTNAPAQIVMSVEELAALAVAVLVVTGANELQAAPQSRAIADAEADGIASIGLFYLSSYY